MVECHHSTCGAYPFSAFSKRSQIRWDALTALRKVVGQQRAHAKDVYRHRHLKPPACLIASISKPCRLEENKRATRDGWRVGGTCEVFNLLISMNANSNESRDLKGHQEAQGLFHARIIGHVHQALINDLGPRLRGDVRAKVCGGLADESMQAAVHGTPAEFTSGAPAPYSKPVM